jgi:hypothetical protein
MARVPPYRRFTHADGRQWEIRLHGSVVELRITSDGETLERRRPFEAPVLGASDLDALVREQLAEGFVERTPPDWVRRLDELVALWEADDPGFDAEVLHSQLLAAGDAVARETLEKLTWWEQGQPRDPQLAHAWLREHADLVLPGVLLALRYPDPQVLLRVDALLAELARPEVREALFSVIEHPTPEAAEADGGRPSNMPLGAMKALGLPDADTRERMMLALDHADERSRAVAAALLAEWSLDDELFAALWRHRTVARQSDGMCWAMLRAAEVRRAPELRDFLRWMQKSARFRAPAYAGRIGDALAQLRNR